MELIQTGNYAPSPLLPNDYSSFYCTGFFEESPSSERFAVQVIQQVVEVPVHVPGIQYGLVAAVPEFVVQAVLLKSSRYSRFPRTDRRETGSRFYDNVVQATSAF